MRRASKRVIAVRDISKKTEVESAKYSKINEDAAQELEEGVKAKALKSLKLETANGSTKPLKDAKYVGAHVSIAGGIHKAVLQAHEIGATAFALFLKSNHQWKAKPLETKDVALFKEHCVKYNYPPNLIVPHSCYLYNIAAPKPEILNKSRDAFIEELHRCEQLGLTLFNIHPGSTCGTIPVEEGIRRCAESINMAHAATKGVTILIENMAGQGNTLGGDFQQLNGIISQVNDKSRVGMCLDTCHAFAYGYDLSNSSGFEKMMSELDSVIGLEYLKAVHLNDSNGELGSHLDRHANIGCGKIGNDGFKRIMKDERFNQIPMVLETPPKMGYDKEIAILKNMCR